ncbi:MAG: hypothetical protein NC421_03770 [Lachnospiraceae bacterium]|nr:hypothetical protein [Lachnospiraceae bacterium]
MALSENLSPAAPRLRLVAELLLHCRSTAVMALSENLASAAPRTIVLPSLGIGLLLVSLLQSLNLISHHFPAFR